MLYSRSTKRCTIGRDHLAGESGEHPQTSRDLLDKPAAVRGKYHQGKTLEKFLVQVVYIFTKRAGHVSL